MSNDRSEIRAKGTVIKQPLEIKLNEVILVLLSASDGLATFKILGLADGSKITALKTLELADGSKITTLQEGQSLKLFWDMEKLLK